MTFECRGVEPVAIDPRVCCYFLPPLILLITSIVDYRVGSLLLGRTVAHSLRTSALQLRFAYQLCLASRTIIFNFFRKVGSSMMKMHREK